MAFNVEQKVKCCAWAIAFGNVTEAIRQFQVAYPGIEPPSNPTITKWKNLLLETGSVVKKYSRRSNEEREELVCASMLRSPGKPKSLRKVELETGVPKSSVQRIIKKNKIKFFKSHLVHQLLEDDPDRRVEFCSRIIEYHESDPDWHTQIIFSDESTFYRNGVVNRHNCNYYNTVNPHILEETPIKSKGITVWASVSCNGVLSYDISDNTMTGIRYARVLNEQVLPHLTVPEMNQAIFQQDGAPPHFANPVKQLLNGNLRGRWIGRGSDFLDWPPRSPDLTVCDFFLWGYLKEQVYTHSFNNDEELKRSIEEELLRIPRSFFVRAYESFVTRCYQCVAVDGLQFE